MKRMVSAVVALLLIGACLPSGLIPIATAPPPLGITQAILQNTDPTQTVTLPTMTAPASVTGTSALPTASPLPSATETATTSPAPNLTTTPATATEFTTSPSAFTGTLAVPGAGTVTSTPGVLTYGTLPPAVPFSLIRLVNRSKAQVYISLQVTTQQGGPTILEYPVRRFVEFSAPTGFYLYVAWVGGNKMVGNFRLQPNNDLTITLYKDRVDIK